jgi:hypothetical protein
MAAGGFGLAVDHASCRSEGPADRPEAGGQARAPRHFPADRDTWMMECGQEVRGLDLGIVTSVP